MKKKYLVIALVLTLITIGSLVIFFVRTHPSQQKKSPSQKGIDWLVDQEYEAPPREDKTYDVIYKLTPDEKLAKKMSGLYRRVRLLDNMTTVVNKYDKKYKGDWVYIELTAEDLVYEQCAGKDVTAQIQNLKNVVVANESNILTSTVNPSAYSVNLFYFLGKLGISYDKKLPTGIVENLKKGGGSTRRNIYGLTHVIFTNSGNFDRYPNPFDFQEEVKIFEKVLSEYSTHAKLSGSEIDMISEVVISMRLLGHGNDKSVKLIGKKIAEAQNSDGSWGTGSDTYGQKLHQTGVAVLALMDYTESPRQGSDLCLTTY